VEKILFDVDHETGMVQYIEPDEHGFTITTSQNIQAALDANKRCQGVNTDVRRGDQTWGHHVASIPLLVWERFCKENPELRQWTPDARAWLLARLNDNEFCHLRTYDGKV